MCGFHGESVYFCSGNTEAEAMSKWRIMLAGLFFLCIQPARTQEDSIQVSLLTCAPGSEIYSLFGHTALRYEDPANRVDLVYNYGMFSFDTPAFVLRFIKGETDYQLGVVPYASFVWQYAMRGSSVYQQVLDLNPMEKRKLGELLEENYRPANRIYRYNYFYDNCTTRARDKVEECIDGTVIYPEGKTGLSFRDIVHQYTQGYVWDELGIDLCLGSGADVPINRREQMFSPFYLREAVKGALVMRNGNTRPLVLKEILLVDELPDVSGNGFPLSPMACALLLLGITALVMWRQCRTGKINWLWDILLFGSQGVSGCIIAFLFFFSVHPTVDSNYLILLFNPVPLVYLPVLIFRAVKHKKDLYHAVNAVYLTLFIIIMPFLPQKFNATVVPLALCLLMCSAGHLWVYYIRNRK